MVQLFSNYAIILLFQEVGLIRLLANTTCLEGVQLTENRKAFSLVGVL